MPVYRCPVCGREARIEPQYGEVASVHCMHTGAGLDGHATVVEMRLVIDPVPVREMVGVAPS